VPARIDPGRLVSVAVSVTLRDARSSNEDREWIRAVYRQYLADLSKSRSGLFPILGEWNAREPEMLAGWFTDYNSHPFVIMSRGRRVGFALVSRAGALAARDFEFCMSEFYVVESERGRGVGRSAADLLFRRFAGDWEVREDEQNSEAIRFWRHVIGALTNGVFRETRAGGEVKHRFRSAPAVRSPA
jgi:predicted acetyltransferase